MVHYLNPDFDEGDVILDVLDVHRELDFGKALGLHSSSELQAFIRLLVLKLSTDGCRVSFSKSGKGVLTNDG